METCISESEDETPPQADSPSARDTCRILCVGNLKDELTTRDVVTYAKDQLLGHVEGIDGSVP